MDNKTNFYRFYAPFTTEPNDAQVFVKGNFVMNVLFAGCLAVASCVTIRYFDFTVKSWLCIAAIIVYCVFGGIILVKYPRLKKKINGRLSCAKLTCNEPNPFKDEQTLLKIKQSLSNLTGNKKLNSTKGYAFASFLKNNHLLKENYKVEDLAVWLYNNNKEAYQRDDYSTKTLCHPDRKNMEYHINDCKNILVLQDSKTS